MKKSAAPLLALVLSLPLLSLPAYADTQSTTVYYSVPATVVISDNGVQTIQKVPVGDTIICPSPSTQPGCTFIGWLNQATGEFWNADDTVMGNMTLIAIYRKVEASQGDSQAFATAVSQPSLASVATPTGVSALSALPQTGDGAPIGIALFAATLAAVLLALALRKKIGSKGQSL